MESKGKERGSKLGLDKILRGQERTEGVERRLRQADGLNKGSVMLQVSHLRMKAARKKHVIVVFLIH